MASTFTIRQEGKQATKITNIIVVGSGGLISKIKVEVQVQETLNMFISENYLFDNTFAEGCKMI